MKLRTLALGVALALGAIGSASALVIDTNVGATPETTLSAAVLASGSGISIVGGTQTYQGNATFPQSATYTGFNLAPSSGSTPTLTLSNGVLLTSGHADMPLTNTTSSYSNAIGTATGSGPNALLSALSGTNTNDANVISFSFTVDPGKTSVSAKFVFGSDEYPTQSVTDIFGFFVDGVNYARFPNGDLISNTGGQTNFIDNPVGGGLYGIEYNGLTQVFTVIGLLDPLLTTHTISFGVADTNDSVWDSGVFIADLTAGTDTGGGGICTNPNGCDPSVVPEPVTLGLFGLGLALLGFGRRKSV